jgi:hypothetical protein
MPEPERVALERVQEFLRAVAGSGREAVRLGPFVAYFDRADPLKYLNYAIPDDGAEPDGAEIAALRAAFHARERLPRLEWIGEVSPAVPGALARAGMAEELETPLMTCTATKLVEALPAVDGLEVGPGRDEHLRASRNVQRVAFGEPPLAEDEAAEDPAHEATGSPSRS